MIEFKDFYVSKLINFYLSGSISFCFMINLLSLPILLDLLSSKSLDFKEIESSKFSPKM